MKKLVFLFSLLASLSFAQTRPQAVVESGVILNGSGMSAAGGYAAGGLYWDAAHVFTLDEAQYSTGGKADDNANTSSKGHTRALRGDIMLKSGKYFIGPGMSWSKLYTPDYDKSSVHPRISVGRSFESGYVDRVLVTYVGSGTDKANGMQGFEGRAFWFIGSHAFMSMTAGGYFGHATVIPISQGGSKESVASELASKTASSKAVFTFGWRF